MVSFPKSQRFHTSTARLSGAHTGRTKLAMRFVSRYMTCHWQDGEPIQSPPAISLTMGQKEGVMSKTLEAGDPAPGFSLPGHNGKTVTLGSFAGKALVLYFYPKDDTSGCTKEAIEFNANAKAFAEAGASILGISPDSPASHVKFKAKHDIGLPLVSDESKATLEAYGVWVEKSMYGRKYMGVERTTFLIKPDGAIAAVWHKVKVPGHAEEVLKAAQKL
jgi:peroxiredoxin Q/BCP